MLTDNLSKYIRVFDARRDLNQVADLIELCFNDTLDVEGKDYIKQMRKAAENPIFINWASAIGYRVSMPLSGFIWEEDEKIIGNLSLIPYYPSGKKYFLIANVAVHPLYRRRGIAKQLTIKAIDHAIKRGASFAWLHVREENLAAHQLYQSLGFIEKARRTTWIGRKNNQTHESIAGQKSIHINNNPDYVIRSRSKWDWSLQQFWLKQSYPPELNWQLALNIKHFMPGLKAGIYSFLTDTPVKHWSIVKNKQLLGVLSRTLTHSYADNLWLAVPFESEQVVIFRLLEYVNRTSINNRPLCLDYPAGREVVPISQAGFLKHQTLIWMSLPLK